MQSITFWSQMYCFTFITCHMSLTHFSYWHQTETGRREVIEIGHLCYYLNLMISNHLFCVHILIIRGQLSILP